MADYLDELNAEQRRAVLHAAGPLLILAGAGSGKTRTLTHRVAHLLQQKAAQPAQILAVTFTNKAAGEMRSRLEQLLPGTSSYLPFLGTFHGVCVRLLREEADRIGLARSFVIFDASDSLAATKHAMRSLQIDEKRFTPALIRSLISSAKNQLVGHDEYSGLAQNPAQETAARVYPAYQEILARAQALDFDDLLLRTVRMLEADPAIRQRWQRQFKHVLIDEYQDTNHAQYRLSRLLLGEHNNVCAVGDDWQSVYMWRGANFQNILNFQRDYPDALVVKLEQNYRSTANILAGAQDVISQNTVRSDKKLWTDNAAGEAIGLYEASSEQDEAEYVVRAIQAGGRPLSDYAVLYRTNAQSRSLEEALIRYGLAYKLVGGVRFYERREVKDVLAYLRLIFQPADTVSFERIVNVPRRGLGTKSLAEFRRWGEHEGLELAAALGRVADCAGLTPRARASLSQLHEQLEAWRALTKRVSVATLIETVIKQTGYFKYLEAGAPAPEVAADRIENVQELIGLAREYDEAGLGAFLEETALLSDLDSYDETAPAVTLMTLHSAKGLEFPEVFIVGLEEGLLPHTNSLYDLEQLEEERRLMYVGMTRAQTKLHLTYATTRFFHGRQLRNPPSRFIGEISSLETGPAATVRASTSAPARPKLKVGDEVRHPAFGRGRLEALEDMEATVKFARLGTKKLHLEYAPLEKVA